jgi:hypothetical protein
MLTAAIVVIVAIICVSVAARMILRNRRKWRLNRAFGPLLPPPSKEAVRYARPDALP